jgi:flagellar hook-length control protein FliK
VPDSSSPRRSTRRKAAAPRDGALQQTDAAAAQPQQTDPGNLVVPLALLVVGMPQAATADLPGGKTLPPEPRKPDPAADGTAPPALLSLPFSLPVPPAPAEAAPATGDGANAPRAAAAPVGATATAAPAPALLSGSARRDAGNPQPDAASNDALAASLTLRSAPQRLVAERQTVVAVARDGAALAAIAAQHGSPTAAADVPVAAAGERSAQPAQTAAQPLPPTSLPLASVFAPPLPQPQQGAAAMVVHPQVGAPDWEQALNQQVLYAVQGQLQVAVLHLNPPQLGPLEVHLQVHDAQVQAQFVSPHALVRQAVEAALPQLRELLGGAGLSLTQTSVGPQSGRGEREPPPRAPRAAAGLTAAVGVQAQPSAAVDRLPLRWQQGMVNTYV